MKKNQENNLVSWDDHLDKKYGKLGTPTRDKYEEDFENFKIFKPAELHLAGVNTMLDQVVAWSTALKTLR